MTAYVNSLPCWSCSSSDAACWYKEDNHGYCFSCGAWIAEYPEELRHQKNFQKNAKKFLTSPFDSGIMYSYVPLKKPKELPKEKKELENTSTTKEEEKELEVIHMNTYEYVYQSYRGVNPDTLKKFDVRIKTLKGEPISVVYPYGNGSSYKERTYKDKNFSVHGEGFSDVPLFGMERFTPGMSHMVLITEGEQDCLSAYQMLGNNTPCVSVKSASSAKSDCEKGLSFLSSFKEIYLCLDNDKPGLEAAKKISSLFDVNKVRFVQFSDGLKDANEYLTKGKGKEFCNAVSNAQKYRPKGIVSSYGQIEEALNKNAGANQVGTYPFSSLNNVSFGIRLGELNLFLAQEKIGKTEVMRAIEHHLIKTTDRNIGIIHLEEEERRTICGLVGYEEKKPVHLPTSGYSNDDILKKYKDLTKSSEDRVYLYSHFGSDDPDIILDAIRYMVSVNKCSFVFLDHITMLVTGFEEDDERKKLDYISTRLAMMTRELGFTLFLVSHVNDDGKTRGSRNIAKVADLIVSLSRDIESADVSVRNTTNLTVRGNRYGGTTGPCTPLFFDQETYVLSEKELIDEVEAKTKF